MRILSVNVGEPREVEDPAGRRVLTSIYKVSVGDAAAVQVRALNIDGDRQADLVKHGGPERAVYMYPAEHYSFWRGELPGTELPWGAFGENLTSEGLLEHDVRIGDRLRVGSTELVVTRPRKPCYKLAIRLARTDIVQRFKASGRSGFYLRVAREGELRAGDAIARIARGDGPTIRKMVEDTTAMATRYTIPRPGEDEFVRGYASYIARVKDIDDAPTMLEEQRDRFVARMKGVSPEKAAFRYAPDKWSVTEVVGHLADAERVFAYRMMRFARADTTPLAGFNDPAFVTAGAFDRRPLGDVVDEWVTVRNATIGLVRGIPSDAWTRRGTANNYTFSTRALLYIALGHIEHHLALFTDRYGL